MKNKIALMAVFVVSIMLASGVVILYSDQTDADNYHVGDIVDVYIPTDAVDNVKSGYFRLYYSQDLLEYAKVYDEEEQAYVPSGKWHVGTTTIDDIKEDATEGNFAFKNAKNIAAKNDVVSFKFEIVAPGNISIQADLEYKNGNDVVYKKTGLVVFTGVSTCQHLNMAHRDAIDATENTDGNIEYWHCSGCHKNFYDSQGINEIPEGEEITHLILMSTGEGYTLAAKDEQSVQVQNGHDFTFVFSVLESYSQSADKAVVKVNGTAVKLSDGEYTIENVKATELVTVEGIEHINQYEVQWVIDEAVEKEVVDYGTIPTHEDPVKEPDTQYTYKFTGWDPEVVVAKADATYTALFSKSIRSYSVIFYDEDGKTVLQSETLNYGTMPEYKVAEPTKESTHDYRYEFIGWDSQISVVHGDQTYKAQYKGIERHYADVVFVNDDDKHTVLYEHNYEYGEIPSYEGETPTKEATAEYTYTFKGWSPEIVAVSGDATYTAVYNAEKNSYLVTFDMNGYGKEIPSQTVEYGSKATKPADPTDSEHTFDTWLTKEGEAYDFNSAITGAITIYAHWMITVTYETGVGDPIEPSLVDIGTKFSQLNLGTPEKDGYLFKGWFRDAEFTSEFKDNDILEIDTVVYAKWVAVVKFIDMEAVPVGLDSKEVAIGSQFSDMKLQDPVVQGYKFDGWYKDAQFTTKFATTDVINVNTSVYLKWITVITFHNAPGYTTLDAELGTVWSSLKIEDPQMEGYMFFGWYTDSALTKKIESDFVVNSNIDAYAKWLSSSWDVRAITEGGSLVDSTLTFDKIVLVKSNDKWIAQAKAIAPPAVTPDNIQNVKYKINTGEWEQFPVVLEDGRYVMAIDVEITVAMVESIKDHSISYSFVIENSSENPVSFIIIVKMGDITLKNNDQSIEIQNVDGETVDKNEYFDISFDSNGGSEVSKQSVRYNHAASAPSDPVRDGYDFIGWFNKLTDTTPYDFSTPVKSENTLYAKWKINQYTISFNTDGGTEIEPITQDYDSVITKPKDPTKTGYTFTGWDQQIPDRMPAKDLVINATWKINQYTISFNTDGGTEIEPITQDYDSVITKPKDPTKTGYTFKGWSPEVPAKMPAKDLEVTAQWEINSYKLTINYTGYSSPIEKYEAMIEYDKQYSVSSPVKIGYTAYPLVISGTMGAKDVEYEVKYTANEYEIEFILGIGSSWAPGYTAPTHFTYGAEMALPTEDDVVPYEVAGKSVEFVGWFITGDAQKVIYEKIPADANEAMSFTAKWEETAKKYPLKFELDGGEWIEGYTAPKKYTFEAEDLLPDLSKVVPYDKIGYDVEFLGWYKTGDSTQTLVTKVAKDAIEEQSFTSLYSETPISYTITYVLNGGTNSEKNPDKYTIESDTIVFDDATRENMVFLGWFIDEKQVISIEKGSHGDVEIAAKWGYEINVITQLSGLMVAIDDGEPQKAEPKMIVNEGSSATFTIDNDKAIVSDGGSYYEAVDSGYVVDKKSTLTFVEGYRIYISVMSPIFEQIKVKVGEATAPVDVRTVLFVPNGQDAVFTTTVVSGTTIVSDLSLDDPVFVVVGTDGYVVSQPVSEKDVKTLYFATGYKLTFDCNNQTSDSFISYVEAEEEFIIPSIGNYTNGDNSIFAGWLNGTKLFNAGDVHPAVQSDTTFTAQWKTLRSVTFKFDANTVIDIFKGYAGTKFVVPQDPTQTGKKFDGWESESTISFIAGSVVEMPDQDIVCTAKWVDDVASITINAENGKILINGAEYSPEVQYLIGQTVTVSAVADENYVFSSWNDGGNQVHAITLVKDNVLSALFKEKEKTTYEIAFEAENGTIQGPTSAEEGSDAVFYIIADDNYKLTGLKIGVDGGEPVDVELTTVLKITNISASQKIIATFEQVDGTSSSTINSDGSVTETQTQNYVVPGLDGTKKTVETVTDEDGSKTTETSLTTPVEDKEVTTIMTGEGTDKSVTTDLSVEQGVASDGNATITVDDDVINAAIKQGNELDGDTKKEVTIVAEGTVSSATKTSTTIPKESMDSLAQQDNKIGKVTIETGTGKMELDQKTLQAMTTEDPATTSVQITVGTADNSDLSKKQQDLIKENEAMSIQVTANFVKGDVIEPISDLEGGEATIHMHFVLGVGKAITDYFMWYVKIDGTYDKYAYGTQWGYDSATNTLWLKTKHFSTFTLMEKYEITVQQGINGTIAPSTVQVDGGSDQQFTITPAVGYKVKDVKVDGISVGAVTSYTFENIVEDHTITAEFEIKGYTVTVNFDSSKGTASVTNQGIAFDEGTVIYLTKSAKTDYVFDSWSSQDVVINNDSFVMPAKNVTITANFKSNGGGGGGGDDPTPVVPADIEETKMKNGSATIEKAIVAEALKEGRDIGFTEELGNILFPNELLKNLNAGKGNLTFTMKVTDVSKVTEAQKKTIGENYAVSIGMTIGKTDVHELGGKVKVNLALAPVPGKDMSKTKVYYVAEDGSIEEMPTSYKEGVVTFEVTHFSVYMVVLSEATPDPPVPTEYTVTIKIEGKGTATASVTKAVEGTKVTLTSEAAERYEFKEWKSSDVTISGNSFTMPAKNVIVTAVFEQEPDDDKGSDDGNVLLYVGIAVALIVVIAALVVFFRRRA